MQIVKTVFNHHFIRYIFVGVTTVSIDLGFLILLHGFFKVNLTLSASISYWLSIVYNFFANRHWVFEAQDSRRLHEHAFLYGCLLGANYLYTIAGIDILTKFVFYELAKIIVISVSIIWTYPIYKKFIFNFNSEV